jgi:hypothetical protein
MQLYSTLFYLLKLKVYKLKVKKLQILFHIFIYFGHHQEMFFNKTATLDFLS